MKLFFKILVFYSLIPFFIFSCYSSQEKQEDIVQRIPDPKTLNKTYVSDPDHILQPSTINLLNFQLRELDKSKKAHIDVVLVNSIGEQVPKDIAYKLFNTWKIGRADTNNGLLIFLVLDQRRVEFETGLGLEPILTDMICGSIQRKYMIPYLKQENYDQAVLSAVYQIIKVLYTGKYSFDDYKSSMDRNNYLSDNYRVVPERSRHSFINFIVKNSSFLSLFILSLTLVIFIFKITKNKTIYSRLARLFTLLGIGLAFFGFCLSLYFFFTTNFNLLDFLYLFFIFHFIIGILFHIKYVQIFYKIPENDRHEKYYYLEKYKREIRIYSLIFPTSFIFLFYIKLCYNMRKYRYTKYLCKKCQKPMVLEKEKKLSKGHMKEEELKSVEYDIWHCNSCNLKTTIRYPNKHSNIRKCTKCHFITSVFKKVEIVKTATTNSSGRGYNVYVCEFCNDENKEKYTTPKISDSSNSKYRSDSSDIFIDSGGISDSSSDGGCSGGGGAGSSW